MGEDMRVFSFFGSRKATSAAPADSVAALADELLQRADATAHGRYLSYLFALFKSTSPYALWQRARTAFAPAIFLSRVFRILRWIFRFIEASALFLVAAAVILLAAPLFLLFLLSVASAAAVSARRTDCKIRPRLEGKRVLIIFSQTAKAAGARPLTALAGDYTVLLVTPLFSAPRAGKGRFHLLSAACFRPDGVILVREYYYFRLARKQLSRAAFCARIC
jgi:hypothetical protein